MSRQIGSLNRFVFCRSNLQRQKSFISISYLTSSPLPSFSSNSPRMDSDVSTETVFNTISNFNDSVTETPDKFIDSEASPTNFSQPPYQLVTPHIPDELCPSTSSRTDATRILYPLLSIEPDENTHTPYVDEHTLLPTISWISY